MLGERRIIHYPQKRIIGLYVKNMDNLELVKQEISNLAKEKKEEFEKVSDYIFAIRPDALQYRQIHQSQ